MEIFNVKVKMKVYLQVGDFKGVILLSDLLKGLCFKAQIFRKFSGILNIYEHLINNKNFFPTKPKMSKDFY